MRQILVTSALCYANGPLHLGHILEQIQTDIWVRFQRLQGHNCLYVSGDDAHGTPIMLSARQKNMSPEQLVNSMKISHEQDVGDFLIGVDNYYTTHSTENYKLTTHVYANLLRNNDLETRIIEQAFDEQEQMFLPDRYIKGTCPRCGASNQYGDNCENCGATYMASELLQPVSVLSGKSPVLRQTEHYFFRLAKYTRSLQEWCERSVQPEIFNKLQEWFSQGLISWDITRDPPYFGFAIPDKPQKYFYVWLDAPLGYIASLENLSVQRGINVEEYLHPESTSEMYHFIGKDIVYFHTLFWPAILESVGWRKPSGIFTHGFLMVNGEKMSKSRGTFILARDYLRYFSPEYLRYYFAAKLGSGIDDIDLNIADFVKRNNSDLIGKVVNIASRTAKFINQNFNNMLGSSLVAPELWQEGINMAQAISEAYNLRNFSHAVRLIMQLADLTNQYIDEHKPWQLAKEDPHNPKIRDICTMGLNMYRLLIIFLKPILPLLAEKSETLLQVKPLMWNDHMTPLVGHTIGTFVTLMSRLDPQTVTAFCDRLATAGKV